MNILIIEDDEFLSRKIKGIFEKRDEVNIIKLISCYDEFLKEYSLINSYNIVLVDICLWQRCEFDAWIEIIKLIRKKNIFIPIIIISWLSDIWWLRVWFDSWANDYICKPFRLAELEIRVFKWLKSFFKIESLWKQDFVEYNDLKYFFGSNLFTYKWNELKLTKINKIILLLFISRNEEILSDIFLIERIWWDFWDFADRNIRVTISRLKKSLKSYWLDNWIYNIRWEWYILKYYI